MKPLKSNVNEARKFVHGGTQNHVRLPNPEKYIGKMIKGELNGKNRHSTV